MVWGYHLRDYGWTPLSQNPARICDDSFRSFCVGRQRYETCSRSQPQSKVFAVLPISADGGLLDIHPMRRGGVKSFVDDLVLGRGVVPSRAATSLRSVETQPLTRRFVRSQTNNISSQLVNGLWAFSSACIANSLISHARLWLPSAFAFVRFQRQKAPAALAISMSVVDWFVG